MLNFVCSFKIITRREKAFDALDWVKSRHNSFTSRAIDKSWIVDDNVVHMTNTMVIAHQGLSFASWDSHHQGKGNHTLLRLIAPRSICIMSCFTILDTPLDQRSTDQRNCRKVDALPLDPPPLLVWKYLRIMRFTVSCWQVQTKNAFLTYKKASSLTYLIVSRSTDIKHCISQLPYDYDMQECNRQNIHSHEHSRVNWIMQLHFMDIGNTYQTGQLAFEV